MHRIILGIKQENLARDIKITKGRMSQIEKGVCKKLTLQRIQRIAEYLQIDFFELFKKQETNTTIRVSDLSGLQQAPPELVRAVLEELSKKLST